MKQLIAITLLLGSSIASAATVVLDFETYETVNTVNTSGEPAACMPVSPEPLCIGGQILHKGYVVDMSGHAWWQGSDLTECNDGSYQSVGVPCNALQLGGWRLTEESGDRFSVFSLDLIVEWAAADQQEAGIIDISSDTEEGLYIQITKELMGVSSGFVGIASATLEINWNNTGYLHFYNPTGDVSIDNIVVSNVVPIPATAYLFGSGLALLGWFRKRSS